ncbi:hypothetical protein [Kribbella antiqua]|nr:hypothetical protein [Kribbella antiqua]
MPAKPIPGLGLVLGILLGYVDIVLGSYAAYRLAATRQVTFDSALTNGVQWFALLLGLAVITGLVMAPRRIGAGVMVGAGALMTLAGLAFQLLPLGDTRDLIKVFTLPGSRFLPYLLLDGSVMFMGAIFLVGGIGRWVSDAKVVNQLGGRLQDGGYNPTYPGQQPQQWGGYPGQQQQPLHPSQQPGSYPVQQQQGGYHPGQPHAGQPQPGQTQPGQHQPGQQSAGGYPGQQQPPR